MISVLIFVLSSGVCLKSVQAGGQSYALTFMNITSDGEDTEGFTQIYVYSKEAVRARIMALKDKVDPVVQVGSNLGVYYNFTEDFSSNQIMIANEFTTIDRLGIAIYSGGDISVVGVKSDRGSTDAFLALKAVKTSKEFVIALWPNGKIFQGSIQITGILNGTCVEVYRIFNGSNYVLVYSNSLNELDVLRFFQRNRIDENGMATTELEDLTGYYVNSSRPTRVVVGHECANVPLGVGYCDHMAEQIPAISQLGSIHVVPPIAGRKLNAGYVLRVVGAQKDGYTRIDVDSVPKIEPRIVRFGEFAQYNIVDNLKIAVVRCNTSCLVMQYNKGFTSVSNTDDTPTDPFMMIVTSSDRFTEYAAFATPSYCDVGGVRTVFDNYISIVTYAAYRDSIRFDDRNASTLGSWRDVGDFSVIYFGISHDHHLVNSTIGGSFAAYVYGHSIMNSSPSGYGFAANYNVTGDAVDNGWLNSLDYVANYLLNKSSAICSNESTLQRVLNVSYASFPFQLTANWNANELSESCKGQLTAQTELVASRIREKINQWICLQLNCSYLGSFGVAVANISTSVTKNDQGKYTGFAVYVQMVASYETQSKDFATCRLEIRNYLSSYRNWLSMSQLVSGAGGCPANLDFKNEKMDAPSSAICRNH